MFKKIKEFPRYEINTEGQVRNYKGKILNGYTNNKGYQMIHLRAKDKSKLCSIHRLVAEAFVPNPDNLPMVNHKDEDKLNNIASNLEWCDNTYNSQYPNDLGVYCFDLDKYFKSASEAAVHTGVCRTSIVKCCNHKLQQAGGMLWCYSKDKDKVFPH